MFGLFKLILDCFRDVDNPEHPEGRRELIRRGMLARIDADLSNGTIIKKRHYQLRKQILDTVRLTRALDEYGLLDEISPQSVEKIAFDVCYEILEYWSR